MKYKKILNLLNEMSNSRFATQKFEHCHQLVKRKLYCRK